MRPKPIRNLYFQFIRGTALDGEATWEHAAKALSDAGYIELILNKYDGVTMSHYVETEVLHALPKEDFEPIVLDTIARYLGKTKSSGRNQNQNKKPIVVDINDAIEIMGQLIDARKRTETMRRIANLIEYACSVCGASTPFDKCTKCQKAEGEGEL